MKTNKELFRICTKCGSNLPNSGFYVQKVNGKKKLKSECKSCSGEMSATHFYKNNKKILKRQSLRVKTEKYRKMVCESARRYDNKHPSRYLAKLEVNKAIKRGDIRSLPCEKCGEEKTEAHHDDYSKPLNIRWLCRICHKKLHRKYE